MTATTSITTSSANIGDLKQEWQLLHQDHEKYEQFSLIIKLLSICLCFVSMAFAISFSLSILFMLVLWLQDGIWKTFQARLCDRITSIEDILVSDEKKSAVNVNALTAFSLYSQFNQQRKGSVALIAEYVKSALRPTVAYPYSVLIIILMLPL